MYLARKNIGIPLDRQNRNNHNDNYTQLFEGVQQVKKTIDDLVLESGGDSNLEVVQARGGESTLNSRLDKFDDKDNELSSQLADIENQTEVKLNEKMDKNTSDISVNQINKNLGKLDETFMSESLLQQMAGDTPIHSVPSVESVTPITTTFLKTGKNLFNKYTAIEGYHVNKDSGALSTGSGYFASDYIMVKGNTNYHIKTDHQFACYDENKDYLWGDTGTNVVQTPENAKYLRVSIPRAYIDTYQVEEGEKETPFEDFKYYIRVGDNVKVYADTELNGIETGHLTEKSVTPEKVDFISTGKNIFNNEARSLNKVLNTDSPVVSESDIYDISDYIPVVEGKEYVKSTKNNYVFYDYNYDYITGVSDSDTFIVPKGARYVRLSIRKRDVETYQLEEGAELSEYQSFRYEFKNDRYSIKTNAVQPIPPNDLASWYKTDSINAEVGEEVGAWSDSSQNGNHVIAPNKENKPTYFLDEQGRALLKFGRTGNDEVGLGSKMLKTDNTRPVFNESEGVSLFIVAKKYSLLEYPASFYETPFFVAHGTTDSFIRTVIRNKFEISSRRVGGDSLSSLTAENLGLKRASHSLSLYEAHIDFTKGTCVIFQDGIEIAKEEDFTTKGVTEKSFNSHISIGDVSNPPQATQETGFSGEIGEIILYNNVKSSVDVEKVRSYLLGKWKIDRLDSRFYATYETLEYSESITENNSSLSLAGTKKHIDLDNNHYNTDGFLYLDEGKQKIYYSSGKNDNPKFLFDWVDLNGEPCENYNPTITKRGDVIFMRLRDRGNPIVYPANDYENPILIDFGSDEAPIAPLMDTGIEHDYDNDFFLSAEYWNPATSGEYQYIWKVEKPYTNKSDWKKVFQQITQMESSPEVEGSIRHFHTLKRDAYTGNWYANTGDQDYQCKTFESTDNGESWVRVGGGAQSDRFLGLIFTSDGAYWGTDSHIDHALYFAPRKDDGLVDFANYKRLTWLSMMQPTYQTVLLRNPNGILLLDRAERS